MAYQNIFCPLCGLVMDGDPDRYDTPQESPPRKQRPWYAEARGVVTTDAILAEDIRLTGIGYIVEGNILVAPEKIEQSYIHCEDLERAVICDEGNLWGYAFHEACWSILCLRLGLAEVTVADSVFQMLYHVDSSARSRFDFGLDYGDVERDYDCPGSVPIDLDESRFADPLGIPCISELEKDVPETSSWCPEIGIALPTCFSNLWVEIQHDILSYLPYSDICSMRLVCRGFALLTSLESLPRSYWRSRFLLGQEWDFMFPDLSCRRDWRTVYFGSINAMAAENSRKTMQSRQRIREMLEHVALTVEVEVQKLQPWGIELRSERNWEDAEDPVVAYNSARKFFGTFINTESNSPLRHGIAARLVYERGEALNKVTGLDAIAVSTVQIGVRTFIAGIGHPDDVDGERWIGYHDPRHTQCVEIPPDTEIRQIRIALSRQGLRAIRLGFSNYGTSRWIGDITVDRQRMAFGILHVTKFQDAFVAAGLDHFKIVWLCLTSEKGKEPSPEEFDQTLPPALVSLWEPDIPEHEGLTLSPLHPESGRDGSESCGPFLNFDFGGSAGVLLDSLTRIVFFLGPDPSPIIGVRAFHTEGSSRLFGTDNGCEICFPVDGAAGERITSVGFLQNDSGQGENEEGAQNKAVLGGLQLCTNHGRTALLATISRQLDKSAPPILVEEAPEGCAITGFFVMSREGRFLRVGLQYQPVTNTGSQSQGGLRNETLEVTESHLQDDESFSLYIGSENKDNYRSYAPLSGVTKILAFGIVWVKGLKFEYEDGSSVQLGQWKDEFASFDLDPDERIQTVETWIWRGRTLPDHPTISEGFAHGVRFVTSHGRGAIFGPYLGHLVEAFHDHARYGGENERLTGISWIFNSYFDRVRGITEDKSNRQLVLLPNQAPPFDQVQKLYFHRILDDGCRDPVVAVTAYLVKKCVLIGLVFTYKSGAIAQIGDVSFMTTTHETIEFPPTSLVVGMGLRTVVGVIYVLQFDVCVYDPDDPTHGARVDRLVLPLDCSHEYDTEIPDDEGDDSGLSYWCQDETTHKEFQDAAANGAVLYAPPEGMMMVGLYVRCQDFAVMGGLYEDEGLL